jgi:hypothetical protein
MTQSMHSQDSARYKDWGENGVALETRILPGQEPVSIHVRGASARISAETRILLSLLHSMCANTDIEIEETPCPLFLSNLNQAQTILRQWGHDLTPVQVSGRPGKHHANTRGPGKGLFFSLGLDSFYSLDKHAADLTHLLIIKAFDAQLKIEDRWQSTLDRAREVANHYGLELITIETDAKRLFLDRNPVQFSRFMRNWELGHGLVLAAVAQLFQGVLGQVIVPASADYRNLKPWGSHPMLDPLWSSSALEVLHDGCEANRFDKARVVANNSLAQKYLRVCVRGDTPHTNCGRCYKCVSTMVGLKALGVLDRFSCFPDSGKRGTLLRRHSYFSSVSVLPWIHMANTIQACEELGLENRARRLRRLGMAAGLFGRFYVAWANLLGAITDRRILRKD